MFRKMRRFNQQIPQEQCVKILKKEPRGVLAVHGEDGYPYAFPINYVYDEENGKIYFHCAALGHKIDAIQRDPKVSFCVYDKGYKKEGDWAWNITSVIIFGHIRCIEDPQEIRNRVYQLGLKYYPTPESVDEEMKKVGSRVLALELTMDHVTGKRVNES